jgi:hypothetical protein
MTTSWTRAAVVALTLGATAMVAPPATAQFFPNFGGGEFYDGPMRHCLMTNSAIRRAIQRQGYTNVYLNVENERRIQSRATKGKWVYLLDVNSCSGRILARERLRPA